MQTPWGSANRSADEQGSAQEGDETSGRTGPATAPKAVRFRTGSTPAVNSPGWWQMMASYGPTVCTSNVSTMEPHSTAAPKSPINNNNTNKSPPNYHLSHSQHVNFKQPAGREMEKEKKQKYLTAKYGGHQMMLIRKRLAVEDWIYEELRTLYHCVDDSEDHSSEFDLEELLDFDEDNERRQYAMEKLSDAKQTAQEVHIFTEEVLRKAKTL